MSTISMRTMTGDAIEVRLANSGRSEPEHGGIQSRVLVSWPTWQRVLASGAFHLDGANEPRGFEPERDVTLELRLRDAVARKAPGTDVAAALADPTSPLSYTEAWLCTAAMQPVSSPAGHAELGIRTEWASPLGAHEPDDLLARVTSSLAGLGLAHDVLRGADGDLDNAIVRFAARAGRERTWSVLIMVRAAERQCIIYSVHPMKVPIQARPGIALLLLEANCAIGAAAFEMDPFDGEVRLRTELIDPSSDEFQDLLDGHLTTMSSYLDAVTLPMI